MEIAVVGGGCSALLLLLNVLPRIKNSTHKITLFSDELHIGRGVAYSTKNDAHLLNGPIGNMSALQDDADHFLTYVRQRDSTLTSSSFVSRRLYGEYLTACWQQLLRDYSTQLQHIATRIEAVNQIADGYALHASNGERYRADYVVLALGHFSKAGCEQRVINSAGEHIQQIGNSWSVQDVKACDGVKEVLLIGSGHTAVDVVLSLQQLKKPPRIHMLSRRGLLSNAHRIKAPEHKVSVGAESLLQTTPTAKKYLQTLRQLVTQYQQQGGDWRDIIGGLRSNTPLLWQRLPYVEQRRFMRHVWPYWDVHRHRLAPNVATQINELLRAQRLIIHAGRIHYIESHTSDFTVAYRPRNQEAPVSVKVNRVIDCTGPNYCVSKIADPLVQQLHQRGVLRQDALQMGFFVADDYCVYQQDPAWSNVFYLGPMMRGRYLESVGVPELRQHAAALAAVLVARLSQVAVEMQLLNEA